MIHWYWYLQSRLLGCDSGGLMKAKTTELKNGETNSCTFRVQLVPQGKNKSHARNLKIAVLRPLVLMCG